MEEYKVPTIDEMKKQADEIGRKMPNIEQKRDFVEIRGYVIEYAISIERSLNELITKSGKDLVLDSEKKEFYLVKGIREKKDLPKFKVKTRDMIKLIETVLRERNSLENTHNLRDAFDKFECIRDIFAHVPLDFDLERLEFDGRQPYKHFFKDSKWKNPFVALNEFMGCYHYLTDAVLVYARHVQIKREIFSQICLGMSAKEFQKKIEDMEKEKK